MQKPIAVFGLGISNLSAIKSLVQDGYYVLAWDDNDATRQKAKDLGALIKELDVKTLKNCECLVLAPGVPLHFPEPHDVVEHAKQANIEIICDIELRYKQGWSCKTVGITGTNGKSTTTALIGHTLKEAGIKAAIGGNIGTPIFDLDIPDEKGVVVLELSSYQLDLCPTFRPDISILLNITPDHLDRHGTMENYAAAKERMFEGKGVAVITGVDQYSESIKRHTSRNLLNLKTGLKKQNALRGSHNIQNMQAAFAVCRELGLSEEKIIEGFTTFTGLPHRQFLAKKINHVEYINDSKATNVEAASKALSRFENIYWIAGGLSKDGGLSGLENFFSKISKTFLIGSAAEEFSEYLQNHGQDFMVSGTMEEAVKQAHKEAQESRQSAAVLLSPAAASFDQYKNFEQRGEDFVRIVEGL